MIQKRIKNLKKKNPLVCIDRGDEFIDKLDIVVLLLDEVFLTGILFICYIRELSWRHGWLLVDTQSINKKELILRVVK